MTATAIPAPLFVPTRPLCDTRPTRGKHRAPRRLALLAWSQRARGAFMLTGMTTGAILAAVLS